MLTAAPPRDPAALLAALGHHQAGRLGLAEAAYADILGAEPERAEALFLLGMLRLQDQRAAAALPLLEHAATLRPGHAETLFALGNAQYRCGRPAEAIATWRALLAQRPGHGGAALNLARALLEAGDAPGAEATARLAIAAAPSQAAGHAVLAQALLRQNRPGEAQAAAAAALHLAPDLAEALLAQGSALRAMRLPEEALPSLRRAAELAPDHAPAQLALGNVLHALGHTAEAEAAIRLALALEPGLAEAQASLCCVLAEAGALPEAILAGTAAVRLRPAMPEAQWNLGIAQLLAGDLRAGFAQYEWRKRHPAHAGDFRRLAGPEWRGGPLAGQRLLVLAEQGLGDAIMFARYLPVLARMGAEVTLGCDPRLHPLLAQLAPVVPKEAAAPPHDLWVDQMSLPLLLGTTLETIPAAAGYLEADPARIARWQARLPPGRRMGVVWSGNPLHSNDARRSLPAAALAPLLALPGWRFLSLQVGARALPAGLQDISDGLTDYAETAAVLALCDVVVTVDTSVAHLAGALGRPTRVLLPHAPDWRWLLGRADTPWYASLRLLRQPAPGDWNGAIAAVLAEFDGLD